MPANGFTRQRTPLRYLVARVASAAEVINTSNRLRAFLVIGFFVILTDTCLADIYRGSSVGMAKLQEYHKLVRLTSGEETKTKEDHAPWEILACPKLLPHCEYIVYYDSEHRIATWVC
jgi:hypothetical protein